MSLGELLREYVQAFNNRTTALENENRMEQAYQDARNETSTAHTRVQDLHIEIDRRMK